MRKITKARSRTVPHLLDDGKKQSEMNTHSVSLLASFVGALPVGGAEQEEDAECSGDSKVFSVRDAVGSPLVRLLLGLFTSGLLTSSAAPATHL